MASFCSACGFPQGANVAFCPNCRARQQGAGSSAPLPQQQPQVAAMAPAKAGSGLQIVLVLVGFLAVAGIAVVGGLFYVGHRVKEAVVDKAKAYGVELPNDPQAHTSAAPVRLPKPCDLLSKEEVASVLGEPIERTEQQSEGCLYYGPAGLNAKLAKEQAASTFRKAQTPGSNVEGSEVATAVDQLANSLGAAEGTTGSGGEAPLLMVMVDPDGKIQMTALSTAKTLFSGFGEASGSKGMSMGTEISGLGDRAIRLPKLGLHVLKGEILVRIIAGPVPDADAKTLNVARAVLKKF